MSWIEMNPTDVGNSIFTEKDPLSATRHHFKIASIETAYKLNEIELLQTLAKSRQGLVSNELRRKIWPVLLGLERRMDKQPLNRRYGSNGNSKINGSEPIQEVNVEDKEKSESEEGGNEQREYQNTIDSNVDSNISNYIDIDIDDDIDDDIDKEFHPDDDVSSISDTEFHTPSWPSSPDCKDKDQVKLDVERSFVFYPKTPTKLLQSKLLQIICTVLGQNSDLCYYQGYHDVAQVILLVYENENISTNDFFNPSLDQCSQILEAISLQMLRDFMTPGLSPALAHLDFIPLILTLEDPYLGEILHDNPPYYALSAVLTLFSHHVRSFDEICIVFDYIIASRNMAMPIYMYIALIISQKSILKESANDPDCIHSLLSNIADEFKGDLFEEVMKPASRLADKYPLKDFKELYNKLSKHSVIKTLSEDNSNVYSKQNLQLILHDQVIECEEQMKEEKLQREKESEAKRKSAAAAKAAKVALVTEKTVIKKTPPQPPSTRLFGKMMAIPIGSKKLMIPKSILGLSICIGVLGVIASSYKYDIQFSWYKFFTQS